MFTLFSMFEFEFYGDFAFHDVLKSLFKCMTFTYASGRRSLRVYLHSRHAYFCISDWTRGVGPELLFTRNWLGLNGSFSFIFSPKL